MANTTKKNSVKKTTEKKVEKVEKTNNYDEQIKELREMVRMLSEQNKALLEEKGAKTVYVEKEPVNPMRMIKVVSLCSNRLDLSQGEHGEGKVYSFSKLGTIKNIPASILDDIVSTHLSLAEKGYFYICDEDFVRDHGLEGDYENLVSADVLESLIKQDKATLKQVLSTCKLSQLDTILNVIAQKAVSKEITLEELEDSGKISVINKICRVRKQNEDYDFSDIIENLIELSTPIEK